MKNAIVKVIVRYKMGNRLNKIHKKTSNVTNFLADIMNNEFIREEKTEVNKSPNPDIFKIPYIGF